MGHSPKANTGDTTARPAPSISVRPFGGAAYLGGAAAARQGHIHSHGVRHAAGLPRQLTADRTRRPERSGVSHTGQTRRLVYSQTYTAGSAAPASGASRRPAIQPPAGSSPRAAGCNGLDQSTPVVTVNRTRAEANQGCIDRESRLSVCHQAPTHVPHMPWGVLSLNADSGKKHDVL